MALKTPRKPEDPSLWIVAGPNGSGKSTFYNRTDIEGWGGSIWIINSDLLTQQIVEHEGDDLQSANGAALDRIMVWLEASIDAYQTMALKRYCRLQSIVTLSNVPRRGAFVFG